MSRLVGRERQTARRERDGLIGPEERCLRFGRHDVGPGRFGVSGAVQMFCAQHGIIDEDRGCGLVQFAPSRMSERAVDAVAHQRMSELEAVPDRTHEDISHQRVADVERLLKQRPQMGQGEALAKDGGGLDGAPVLARQQIRAGEDNVLD